VNPVKKPKQQQKITTTNPLKNKTQNLRGFPRLRDLG
jgi:hypothetical protein